jgi:hypothetical protein
VEESLFDMMERMESLVPEYSYGSVESIIDTDRRVKGYLVSELKLVKDYMFHVVQVSYELQRDRLSEAAEDIWDEIKSLVSRMEVSKTCGKKGSKACEECRKRIEKNLSELISRDRQLVMEVSSMKTTAQSLYGALLEKGREKYFIKNLDKIKTYAENITSILDDREKNIIGW